LHVSCIGVNFLPFFVAYAYGKRVFSGTLSFPLLAFVLLTSFLLYDAGTFDYISYKLTFYAVDSAANPDGYLAEVPSVTSGLVKRFTALSLIWFGTRGIPELRYPVINFCIIETVLYGLLGSLSPVLAVAANYFSIAYFLPILLFQNFNGAVTTRRLILLSAAMVYYVPTSVGLINLLGNYYVS